MGLAEYLEALRGDFRYLDERLRECEEGEMPRRGRWSIVTGFDWLSETWAYGRVQ